MHEEVQRRAALECNPLRAEISPEPFLTVEEIRAQILATFPRD